MLPFRPADNVQKIPVKDMRNWKRLVKSSTPYLRYTLFTNSSYRLFFELAHIHSCHILFQSKISKTNLPIVDDQFIDPSFLKFGKKKKIIRIILDISLRGKQFNCAQLCFPYPGKTGRNLSLFVPSFEGQISREEKKTTLFDSIPAAYGHTWRKSCTKKIRLSTTVCGPLCRKSVKPSPKSPNYPPNSKCRGNFATLAPSLKLGLGQVASAT